MTNIEASLPEWAREALARAGAPLPGETDAEGQPYTRANWCAEGFAQRIAGRWLEIERDVLPALEHLSDAAKCCFFEMVFLRGINVAADTPRKARGAVHLLGATRRAIADKAVEMAELLRKQAAIREDGLAECDVPDLYELLEEAAADYPDWAMVADAAMERFLTVATHQSRPGPGLDDVLLALARRLEDSPLPQVTEPAFYNRQVSQADFVRLLLGVVDGLPRWGVGVSAGFALSDSAVATLVSVAFDLPEGQPSEESVRFCRRSWRQQPAVDSLTDPPRDPRPAAPRQGERPSDRRAELLSGRWTH